MSSDSQIGKNIGEFVAKRIREARKQARLSQKNLADSLGVSDKTVSSWEVGRAEPSLDTLFKIGEETNRPIDFFLKDEDYSISSQLMTIEAELQKVRELLSK